MLSLIAIDPGGRTGFAHCVIRGPEQAAHEKVARFLDLRTFIGEPKAQALALFDAIFDIDTAEQEARTIVVCEDFVAPSSHRTANVLVPHAIARMLEYHVWLENACLANEGEQTVEWRYQRPSERNVISDDNLRNWGMWKPGKKHKDEMAALKHLIVLARKLEKEHA